MGGWRRGLSAADESATTWIDLPGKAHDLTLKCRPEAAFCLGDIGVDFRLRGIERLFRLSCCVDNSETLA